MMKIHTMTQAELDAAPVVHDEPGFGALQGAGGNLPLAAMDVDARVTGLVSRVTVKQTYVNQLDEPIEATYVFPLPSRAAVTAFQMEVAGRVVTGELRERGAARAAYREAIQEGKRAALAEEDRPDVFTMQVGNILPGERAVVTLSFCGPVPLVDQEACFRFPLVVAPRYIPGAPLTGRDVGDGIAHDTGAVPDASRITPPVLLPGFKSPVQLSLRVELDPAGLDVSAPRVSLHTVVEEDAGDRHVLALQPGERLDRDFILRFAVAGDAVGDALVLQPDAEGDAGTFLLTLTPPAAAHGAARPRDVVFVLDRSGSMGGWKMVAARRALARMLDTLSDRDRVQVLAFDNRVDTPHEGLQAATDRCRYRTIEFLAGVDARGGTEMLRPLEQGLGLLRRGEAGRDRVLVLVTDGQIGNEDQLLSRTRLDDVRVFTLGIDRAVNEGFLRRLAELGGGEFELVESEDRLDEVMDRIHRRIGTPVLTDLVVRGEGWTLDQDAMVPRRLPDLFAGAPLLLYGRYSDAAAEPVLELEARTAAGTPWTARVAGRPVDGTAVTPLWARGRIRALEDRHATGRDGDFSSEIVATSLRFSVLSRFTAFVAVDQEVVNEGGVTHRVIQPVEAPQGWGMDEIEFGASRMNSMMCDMDAMMCGMDAQEGGEPASASPPRSASRLNVDFEGLTRGLGRLFKSKARKRRPEREEAQDLATRMRAMCASLRAGSGSDELTRTLRGLLDELLLRGLEPEELRQAVVDLRDALEHGWLDEGLATRALQVFERILADAPRREEFWK